VRTRRGQRWPLHSGAAAGRLAWPRREALWQAARRARGTRRGLRSKGTGRALGAAVLVVHRPRPRSRPRRWGLWHAGVQRGQSGIGQGPCKGPRRVSRIQDDKKIQAHVPARPCPLSGRKPFRLKFPGSCLTCCKVPSAPTVDGELRTLKPLRHVPCSV
jgi:hypothetical protein